MKQNSQFGNHDDLHPEGKIKSFILHPEHSLQNNVRYSLGPSYKGRGTHCQVQPEILEAPAPCGTEEWLYLHHKFSSTLPQFLFLTLLSFTPSTRKFTFEKYFPASPISWTAEPESCWGCAASQTLLNNTPAAYSWPQLFLPSPQVPLNFKAQKMKGLNLSLFQICVYWLDCLKSGDCKITACSPGRKSRCGEGKRWVLQTSHFLQLPPLRAEHLVLEMLFNPTLGNWFSSGKMLLFISIAFSCLFSPSLPPFSYCCKIDWGKVGKEWCWDHPNSSWGRRWSSAALECSFVHSDPVNLLLLGHF